ncbi:hypothetical protein O181_110717 [Austropuccinia psidii MF-1]|uniref:Uncharacterized protein n=1 Tax=Austropuccinia psidii MF-1 TaxID=1389203 RepID=A0A9Q3JYK6_9BASI|nr:hypothetical protein [Austropuccinia psidii MF-1]
MCVGRLRESVKLNPNSPISSIAGTENPPSPPCKLQSIPQLKARHLLERNLNVNHSPTNHVQHSTTKISTATKQTCSQQEAHLIFGQ